MWRLTGPSLTATTGLAHKDVQLTETPLSEVPRSVHVAPISIEMYQFEKVP